MVIVSFNMQTGIKIKNSTMKKAEILTEKGLLIVELYDVETPITVDNFVKLSKMGFYDGLKFHRVIPEFVLQVGCPYSIDMSDKKLGSGGPGYNIDCETSAKNQFHERGVLSMAHAGKNTGGSQFFICLNRQNTKHLDGVHTCFGKVIEGVDFIDEINVGDEIISIKILD